MHRPSRASWLLQITFTLSKPSFQSQPVQHAPCANPFIAKITPSQTAAAITSPAFPWVPHLFSRLRKYPVRLSYKCSFSFRLEIPAVLSTKKEMKKPKSDSFLGKVCSVFLITLSGYSLQLVRSSSWADGLYREVKGTDFQLETSVNFKKLFLIQ